MATNTITVNALDLVLDYANPRFIVPPSPTQDDIRLYLFRHEEIVPLAKGIVSYGGLMPGERIIVYQENDKYVVLEGNRRVCACQCLINPILIPDNQKKTGFPIASDIIKNEIEKLDIDLIPSREEAQRVLAARHIEGVKKWPPIAQMKFSAEHFESGKSIEDIAELTELDASKIKTHVQEYKLLKYALNLSVWTSDEKTKLDLHELEIDRYLRLFRTSGTKKALKLKTDKNSLEPVSELPIKIFKKSLELIARAAFIDNTISTRTSSYEDVPGLNNLLKNAELKTTPPPPQNPILDESNISPNSKSSEPKTNSKGSSGSKHQESTHDHSGEHETKKTNPDDHNSPKPSKVDPPKFFEHLSWMLNEKNADELAVVLLADEIRRISANRLGSQRVFHLFPITASFLLRSLIEQTFKYFLLKEGHWGNVKKKPEDPALKDLLSYIQTNKKVLFTNLTISRAFDSVFKNDGLKDHLDLIMHQTGSSRPTPEMLETIASAGLFTVINFILNKQYTT